MELHVQTRLVFWGPFMSFCLLFYECVSTTFLSLIFISRYYYAKVGGFLGVFFAKNPTIIAISHHHLKFYKVEQSSFAQHLAHFNRRIKQTFLINRCLSSACLFLRPTVCKVFTILILFCNLGANLTKPNTNYIYEKGF